MIPQRRYILIRLFELFDLLNMVLCFILAVSIESNLENITFNHFLSLRIKVQNVLIIVVFLLIWHYIFSGSGLYSSRRFSTRWNEIVDILKATSIGTIVLFMLTLVFNIRMISNTFLTVFWVSVSANTILSRLMLRYVLKQFRIYGRNLRNIIIVGTNPRAIQFAQKIKAKPELGYRLMGFVDNVSSKLQEFQKSGYHLIAGLSEFPAFLRNHVVDEVMVCLPLQSLYQQTSQIVALCEEQGIIVRFLSELFNLKLARSKTEQFEGNPVITIYNGHMEGFPFIIKRTLDFVVSLVLIILLSPLLLFTTLLIKLTSPGPIFFSQERLGLNKRRIRVFKFRTMVPDAEKKQAELEHLNEVSGPVFKINNDPRITLIGKFLRKTSIDELPQLFNVLKGDMSLVGPRPLPVRDYEGFDQDWHRRRFSVQPGITCLWQISGRNNISFDRWMELDMEYIDNWSLWLDLKILLGTIPAVLRGSGAA